VPNAVKMKENTGNSVRRPCVWDRSGDPDLKVSVSTDNDSHTTGVKNDRTDATFTEKAIRVQEGDTLTINVYDSDIAFDDTIGTYSKLITAETIRQGTVRWSFGRVSTLVLQFEP